ncbi:MAG: acetyl-CoA carboxylase biotin carboxyl carrier protein [Eggerthellaceae bacterium]|jgi:acetyl-CoA carboxylase biotin carboxyl carrier protein
MNTDNIKELLTIMDEANLSALRFDDGDVKIELERNASVLSGTDIPHMAERVRQLLDSRADSNGVTEGADSLNSREDANGDTLVRSPMVGTFYESPSPDEEPFVKVGQEVLAGQTLGIVEAMKMMNEITSPTPGIVTEILAANGTQVEYDQVLFRISTKQ